MFQEISSITEQWVHSPSHLALRGSDSKLLNKELISHLLLAARWLIAEHWKGGKGLHIDNWYQRVWQITLLAKLTPKLRKVQGQQSEDKFEGLWKKFINYVNQEEDGRTPPLAYIELWKTLVDG